MEIKSDPESSLKGTNPQDHNILCNLANLYKDMFKSLDAQRLTRWLPELIAAVINRSVNLPLVSAFYKLMAAILNVADRTDYFQVSFVSKLYLSLFSIHNLNSVLII